MVPTMILIYFRVDFPADPLYVHNDFMKEIVVNSSSTNTEHVPVGPVKNRTILS